MRVRALLYDCYICSRDPITEVRAILRLKSPPAVLEDELELLGQKLVTRPALQVHVAEAILVDFQQQVGAHRDASRGMPHIQIESARGSEQL